jgi:methionyl-tRNA formyltransferase
MRIVFLGTPDFAVGSLKALLDAGFEVSAVVTAPDRPAGRGQQLHQSAVKKFALSRGLKIMQPEKLKDAAFLSQLAAEKADLQVVVAFRMLPVEVWNMPVMGTYNLHASLLPKYRGAAPINWAVMNGEKETGVTTFKLRQEIDSGNILMQEKVMIGENETAGELHDKLMETGAGLMVRSVNIIKDCFVAKTEPQFFEQEERSVTHAPKIFRDTCRISWNDPPKKIHDLVRGLSPQPAAFTTITRSDEQVIKIFRTLWSSHNHEHTNGSVLTDNTSWLKVCCAGGLIEILELQMQGKKRMSVTDFLRGNKFTTSDRFV